MKTLPPVRRCYAFSLLELLVAIGVVAVLASILVAVSQHARQEAQAAQCLNHLRQAGAGLLLYAAASNGEIRSLYGGGYANKTWGKILMEGGYVPHRPALRCPTGATTYALDSKTWDWQTFGMNMAGSPGVITTVDLDRIYSLRLANVSEPSRHVLISDSAVNEVNRNQSFRTYTRSPSTGIHLRHRGRANLFFLDGHAESARYDQLKELVDEKGILK